MNKIKNILIVFLFAVLLCQCTSRKNNSNQICNEIDTTRFDSQFLTIIKAYVDSHPQFDSYIVSSQYTIAGHFRVQDKDYNQDVIKRQRKYFLTPAANRYTIELTSDSVFTFFCCLEENLSSYIMINNKKVYIHSEIDDFSRTKISVDSIRHNIISYDTGCIWCLLLKNNKFYVISKNVEEEQQLWPGIICIEHAIKFK